MSSAPIQFGRYQLLRKLGRGGMAEVFLAQLVHGGVAKYLAIKRLLPPFGQRPEIIERLAAEARVTVWLTHPSIVQVYDFGRVGEDYFIAMEYVEGCDLRALLRHGKGPAVQLPMEVAVEVAYRICDALRYAHSCTDDSGAALGIIHRDVSPANILIALDGYPKLADFGVARARAAAVASGYDTKPGAILGKYNYMAPEQALGGDYDARVDLYAVGATLYQMLTGERPFSDREAQLRAGRFELPRAPSELRPSLPRSLDALVLRAMAPDPAARFQNADQLTAALLQELVNLGGPPRPHQLRRLVEEALRARGESPRGTQPTERPVPARSDSLILEQVTAVHRAIRKGWLPLSAAGPLPDTLDAGPLAAEETDPGSVEDTLQPALTSKPARQAPLAEVPTAPWVAPASDLPAVLRTLNRFLPAALILTAALLLFGLGLLVGRRLSPSAAGRQRVPATTAVVRSPAAAAPAPRAVPPASQPAPPSPPATRVVRKTDDRPAGPRPRRSASADDPMAILRRAQEAYASGHHQRAVVLAQSALRLKPNSTMGLQIWGASSCYLRREREARTAAARLPAAPRELLRQVCKQAGIKL
jgi:tRNA A-37 threonylcarbamoyl transferase component Bud32